MNLTALLQERQAKVDELRDLVECADRGEIKPDEVNKRSATLSAAIRELDARLTDPDVNGDSIGLRAQTGFASGDRDTRTLGEALHDELRSIFTPGGGSALVPAEQLRRVFDRLAEASVGLASGFQVIPTTASELRIPHIRDHHAGRA
jgi:hypothetical protein